MRYELPFRRGSFMTFNSDIFYLDDEEDVVCASALCAQYITIS
jgi:hypothetical protein